MPVPSAIIVSWFWRVITKWNALGKSRVSGELKENHRWLLFWAAEITWKELIGYAWKAVRFTISWLCGYNTPTWAQYKGRSWHYSTRLHIIYRPTADVLFQRSRYLEQHASSLVSIDNDAWQGHHSKRQPMQSQNNKADHHSFTVHWA